MLTKEVLNESQLGIKEKLLNEHPVWELNEQQYTEADKTAPEALSDESVDDDLFFASLSEALKELGYNLEQTLAIVATRSFPDVLIELVAQKVCRSSTRVSVMLLAQCSLLQPRLEASVEEQRQEREKQRLAEEQIKQAAAAERQRLQEAEEERRRKRMGAFICGVCGRLGCPVMPRWHEWDEKSAVPANNGAYNGDNGAAVGGGVVVL